MEYRRLYLATTPGYDGCPEINFVHLWRCCARERASRELYSRRSLYSAIAREPKERQGERQKVERESIEHRDRGVIAKGDKEVSVALGSGQHRWIFRETWSDRERARQMDRREREGRKGWSARARVSPCRSVSNKHIDLNFLKFKNRTWVSSIFTTLDRPRMPAFDWY